MATLTSLPPWTERVRIVPPSPDEASGVWHIVGLKFGRLSVGRGGRDAEFCLGWDDPQSPPTPEYLTERFSDPRWYVCQCSRCRGEVVLVFAPDGLSAVMIRDGLSRQRGAT